MPSTISPNMGLIIPTVGQEPGPDWANDVNSSLGTLDQHSHVAGQGVAITPDAININADLPINGNNLTLVKTVNFQALGASLAGAVPDLGCIYVAGNELYYNDEAGNVVPITNNGSVNAGAGSITGLPSGTASASYSSGTQTFIWQSATLTPANMDAGAYIFRNLTPSSFGITVSAPNALAADYGIQWPTALPASTKFLTIDTAGNIGDVRDVDNVTIEVSSDLIQVKAGGITATQIADNSVTNIKLNYSSPSVFTSSGSFNVPSNCTRIRVIGCGGGGGGGGGSAAGAIGGGGGAGAPIFEGIVTVVPGDTLTVTVGTGGAGSNNSPGTASAAGSGTDSSIVGTGINLIMRGAQGANQTGAGSGGIGFRGTQNGGAAIGITRGTSYLQAMSITADGITVGGGAAGGGGGGSIGEGGDTSQGPGIGGGGGGGTANTVGSGQNGGDGQVTIYLDN